MAHRWIMQQGELFVPEKGQIRDHHEKAKLFYGKDERGIVYHSDWGLVHAPENPYFVFLKDLKKIAQAKIPYRYVDIDNHTKAAKTLSGGIIVKRKDEVNKGIRTSSSFTWLEYMKIKEHFK
jgi:hypothetical protein